jgi:hypothetical protein
VRVFEREHLRHIQGGATTGAISLDLCVSSPGLPETSYFFRSRDIPIFEKIMEM